MQIKVSIVIASYNMAKFLPATLHSCLDQDYRNFNVILYDDCSTDRTEELFRNAEFNYIKYYRGENNLGVGNAFNAAIEKADGDIIVLMCADDLFTNRNVISDMVDIFKKDPRIGYVSRWYYQFIDGDSCPVRAWRTNNPIIQANNPSGLAFTKRAIECKALSNKMFIESSYLASKVINAGWHWEIIKYDTIAARVHRSTSTTQGYWLKRRVSSPVMDWWEIGGREIAQDYTSFIQIKTGFKVSAVLEEIGNFIKLRPLNLLHPAFWFFAIIALITPRRTLKRITEIYRDKIGRRITKEIKRPCA